MEKKRYMIILHFDNQPLVLKEMVWCKTEEEAKEYAEYRAGGQHADRYSVILWPPITPSKTL